MPRPYISSIVDVKMDVCVVCVCGEVHTERVYEGREFFCHNCGAGYKVVIGARHPVFILESVERKTVPARNGISQGQFI